VNNPGWIKKTEKRNGKRSLRYLRSSGDGARARLGEQLGQNGVGNRKVAGGKGVKGHQGFSRKLIGNFNGC